jgi:hypothetical protein
LRRISVFTFLLALSIPALGSRRPSDLSIDERLALRFDTKAASERAHAFAREINRPVDAEVVIQGTRNPEVFLPHELMDNLLLATLAHEGEKRRLIEETYEEGLHAISAEPAQFWTDLHDAGKAYHAAWSAVVTEKRLDRNKAEQPRLTGAAVALCRARKDALVFMRSRYARFDEFLYATVAPRIQLVSRVTADAPTLRMIEGGCK